MYSIIIERSQDCMQVVGIFRKSTEPVRKIANGLSDEKKVDDYDVCEFDTLDELNDFLLSNLTI